MTFTFSRIIVAAPLTVPLTVSASETIPRKVVKIADGDTLTLLNGDKKQVKIPLAQIDTPERPQPWGNRAKQALSEKVFGESERVEVETTDRYGRTVGEVFKGKRWINAELVAEGHAWVYRKYMRGATLLEFEAHARAKKLGLWSLPDAEQMAPWAWRRK